MFGRFCLFKSRLKPSGGLDIFTYMDQRSIFGGFEFRKSVFFWVLVRAVVFFGGFQTNAVFLSVLHFRQYFLGPVLLHAYMHMYIHTYIY